MSLPKWHTRTASTVLAVEITTIRMHTKRGDPHTLQFLNPGNKGDPLVHLRLHQEHKLTRSRTWVSRGREVLEGRIGKPEPRPNLNNEERLNACLKLNGRTATRLKNGSTGVV